MAARPAFRALIADDERLLREQLRARLLEAWPGLEIVGEARDGREAVEAVASLRPDVAFLDIRMPVMTGIEAAREIVRLESAPCEVVFVTAYDQYAIDAFEQGAIDYVLKPAETQRLRRTVDRLVGRLEAGRGDRPAEPGGGVPADPVDRRLAQIEALLQSARPRHLRWLQATQGTHLRLIDTAEVLFFRSDEKYTRVQTAQSEWLIRTPLRDLVDQLDPEAFWQIHRGSVVNVRAIERVERDDTGRLRVRLREHPEVLEVSRSYQHLFRQM